LLCVLGGKGFDLAAAVRKILNRKVRKEIRKERKEASISARRELYFATAGATILEVGTCCLEVLINVRR
jgi:hypothetical protein